MADTPVTRADITGLVLAGGQGSRLGGVDKGLQAWQGKPLAAHALERLAPQVGRTMLSANRHLDTYAGFGVPVWPDPPEWAGYQGPLAGVLAGLQHCETRWLLTVPCDCPRFPVDLAERLAKAVVGDVEVALAATDDGLEPTFCLMRRELEPVLVDYLARGQRKLEGWSAPLKRAVVRFDDPTAFFNINTPGDLASP